MSLRDIVDMRVGDVIPLDVPEVLQAEVDGVPVFEVPPRTKNGHYAIKVERFVGPEEAETPQIPGGHNG